MIIIFISSISIVGVSSMFPPHKVQCILFVSQMQQLFDLVVTCKRNAEIEVNREEGQQGAHVGPGRKRKMEQKMAERALKFLKASQDPGGHKKIPGEGQECIAKKLK